MFFGPRPFPPAVLVVLAAVQAVDHDEGVHCVLEEVDEEGDLLQGEGPLLLEELVLVRHLQSVPVDLAQQAEGANPPAPGAPRGNQRARRAELAPQAWHEVAAERQPRERLDELAPGAAPQPLDVGAHHLAQDRPGGGGGREPGGDGGDGGRASRGGEGRRGLGRKAARHDGLQGEGPVEPRQQAPAGASHPACRLGPTSRRGHDLVTVGVPGGGLRGGGLQRCDGRNEGGPVGGRRGLAVGPREGPSELAGRQEVLQERRGCAGVRKDRGGQRLGPAHRLAEGRPATRPRRGEPRRRPGDDQEPFQGWPSRGPSQCGPLEQRRERGRRAAAGRAGAPPQEARRGLDEPARPPRRPPKRPLRALATPRKVPLPGFGVCRGERHPQQHLWHPLPLLSAGRRRAR